MELTEESSSIGKAVVFWVLFGLGTAVLAFAILLTPTPGEDRTFDLIMLSIAGVLLTTAFVLARLRTLAPGGWRMWPVSAVVLSGELLLCIYGIISVVTYGHR